MRLSLLIAVILSTLGAEPRDDPLTPEEIRGRRIYLQGEVGADRELVARVGAARTPVPARALPCSGCHGFDGRGLKEAGVEAPDITWTALTRPYGSAGGDGHRRPPYDEASIRRAVSLGVDAAGRRLSPVMPSYDLSLEAASDLLAYLRRIGTVKDPGVDDGRIRIGILLPGETASSRAQRLALSGIFAELERSGGVHGRRCELVFAAGTEEIVERGDVFAVLAPSFGGDPERLSETLDAHGLPWIGGTSTLAIPRPSRYLFHAFADLRIQALALVEHAARSDAGGSLDLAVLHGTEPWAMELAREAAERWRRETGRQARPIEIEGDASVDLRGIEGGAALLLVSSLAGRDAVATSQPEASAACVLVPGALWTPALADPARRLAPELRIAAPRGPGAPASAAARELLDLTRRIECRTLDVPDVVTAWCTARILIEALRRCGREVGRERLVRTLEGTYELDVGVSPPITFGPTRRIGGRGAYIVTLHAGGEPATTSSWVEVQ